MYTMISPAGDRGVMCGKTHPEYDQAVKQMDNVQSVSNQMF